MQKQSKTKNCIINRIITPYMIVILFCSCTSQVKKRELPCLKISANHRFLVRDNDNPFFWLGDTGWLLFTKLDRKETETYLEKRKEQGFNVIQVMIIHDIFNAVDVYGDSALIDHNLARPKITKGNNFSDSLQYDFWDHVDWVINRAAQDGLYMAMVPVWGSNVKNGHVTRKQAGI